MIIQNKLKKSEAKHIIKLIEQMSRAEVMARLAPIGFPAFADYAMIQLEKKDELLEYIYGTSSLVELGRIWCLPIDKKEEPKRKKKQKNKSKKKKNKKGKKNQIF